MYTQTSQNFIAKDWKFLRFSACKKEHNASVFLPTMSMHENAIRHNVRCKYTDYLWIIQVKIKKTSKFQSKKRGSCLNNFSIFKTNEKEEIEEIMGGMAVQKLTQDVRFRNSDVHIVAFFTSLYIYFASVFPFLQLSYNLFATEFRWVLGQITMRSWKHHDAI